MNLSTLPRALLAAGLLSIGACRLDGDWKTVSVHPPGVSAPLDHLSLRRDGSYSAMWAEEGEKRGSSGQYQWNGRRLSVAELGYEPRNYRLKRRWDGKMVLSSNDKQNPVAITLERIDSRPSEQATKPAGSLDQKQIVPPAAQPLSGQ